MDYLDWQLALYQDDQDHRCDHCGEYCDEEWTCDCEDEEEEIYLGI